MQTSSSVSMIAVLLAVLGVAAVCAQSPSQRLDGISVQDLQSKSSVTFSFHERKFAIVLGPLQQSVSGSYDAQGVSSAATSAATHREGTVDGATFSQVSLSFFTKSGKTRAYGVIEVEGGSDAQRTFDLETNAAGDLILQERPHIEQVKAPVPKKSTAQSSTDAQDADDHSNHPIDFIRVTETIPEAEQDLHRKRRAGPNSAQHTACGVFLDIDSSFYNQWGVGGSESERVQAAIDKATSYLRGAASIYASNFGSSVVLEVAGAHVFTTGDFGASASVSDSSVFLNSYSSFLAAGASGNTAPKVRGSDQPSSQDVCLNVAVTHRNFGSVVGVAYIGSTSSGYVGGICSFSLSSKKAYNSGFVDSWGSRDSTVMSRGIAHEIGHAFGAEHVCCDGTCGCSSGGSCTNSYIMFWMLSYGSNGGTFSACSRQQIAAVISAKGSCLTVPGSGPAQPTTAATVATTQATTVITQATTQAPAFTVTSTTTTTTTRKATTKKIKTTKSKTTRPKTSSKAKTSKSRTSSSSSSPRSN